MTKSLLGRLHWNKLEFCRIKRSEGATKKGTNERTKMDWWKRLSVIKFVSCYTCPILGRLQSLWGFGSDIYEQLDLPAVQYSVRRTVFSICKLFRPRACIVYTFSVRRLRRKSQSLRASEEMNVIFFFGNAEGRSDFKSLYYNYWM